MLHRKIAGNFRCHQVEIEFERIDFFVDDIPLRSQGFINMIFFENSGFAIRPHGANPCDHVDEGDGVGNLQAKRRHAFAVFFDQFLLNLQPFLQQRFGLIFGYQSTLE
ncbi:MAG: hypothetical protein QNI85_11360 [Desulfobacterales bacterium]|nr:hypothetical protein [Desulfobacterales bacterium]